jgi:hypothetical protein
MSPSLELKLLVAILLAIPLEFNLEVFDRDCSRKAGNEEVV